MTILWSLVNHYARLAARGEAPMPGFAPAQIGFTIVLSADGSVVRVDDERVREGKHRRPKIVEAPLLPNRTVAVASGAFWDKTSYVLGRTSRERQARDGARVEQEHAAFKARHEQLLKATTDAGCKAVLAFLRRWTPQNYERLPKAEELLDQNVAFRLDGEREFVHQRPAARAALLTEAASAEGGDSGKCLITGITAPIARLHNPPIKGVSGALSSGARLVSFNLDAFNSYRKIQGGNAPVSEYAAFAYATALNALLAATDGADSTTVRPRYRNRIGLGGDTVVFWAETPEAEDLLRVFFVPPHDPNKIAEIRKLIETTQAGHSLSEAMPQLDEKTGAYVLGLSPNAGRLSVRFWLDGTLGDLARRFAEHWADLSLDPFLRTPPPPLWALLQELAAQRKAENVPPHLAGEVTRAILTGRRYPTTSLIQTVMRIRTDQDRTTKPVASMQKVNRLRVSLVKAYFAREYRKGLVSEDVPVSLDPNSTNTAYRLGRLFAVLERLHRAALGQRSPGIRERFYAPASSTPAIIYPLLIRNALTHCRALRLANGPGFAEWFEDRIDEIAAGLNSAFPKTLSLPDQGRFALGYYHEREFLRLKRADKPIDFETSDSAADETAD